MKENLITATVNYLDHGTPHQRQITGINEEEMLTNVFWFQAENGLTVRVKQVHYLGKTIEWEGASTYAHYWLGKGRMSFKEFKAAVFDERVAV